METIAKQKFLDAIENGYEDMKTQKKTSSVIRFFEEIKTIISPRGKMHPTTFVKILRIKKRKKRHFKILYGEGKQYFLLPVNTAEQQTQAIEYLKRNNILPEIEHLGESFTLNSSLGARFLSCGCCD